MGYSSYLPNIDVNDGVARVMNNVKLYLRLLGKFDGAAMAAEITQAIDAGDKVVAASAAHKLRGTAANLSFPAVMEVASKIESLAKEGQDCSHLVPSLKSTVTDLACAIQKFIAEQ